MESSVADYAEQLASASIKKTNRMSASIAIENTLDQIANRDGPPKSQWQFLASFRHYASTAGSLPPSKSRRSVPTSL